MMKKYYQEPSVKELEMDEALMDTVSGEGGSSGVKPGEGGRDLSRRGRIFSDEDED